MASTQELINERRLQFIDQPSESEFSKQLEKGIRERTGAGDKILGEIERQRAELPAVREELRGELQHIQDPFQRRALVERDIASRKASIATLERGFDLRQQGLAQTITAATEAFKSSAARDMARLDVMQDMQDREDRMRQQEFQNKISSASSARAAASASREQLTDFEKTQHIAQRRGGDIQIDPQTGKVITTIDGKLASLNAFTATTGLSKLDVLNLSQSEEEMHKFARLAGIRTKVPQSSIDGRGKGSDTRALIEKALGEVSGDMNLSNF